MDNIAILTSSVYQKWNHGQVTCAFFMDIKDAFDNVLWDILLNRLVKLHVPDSYIAFVYNMISHRNMHFRFNEIDEIRIVNKGLPQGCVLSPILYSLYTAELESLISQKEVQIIQFADDVCLSVSDALPNAAIAKLNSAARVAVEFFKDSGLSVAPNKSQFCIFSPSHNQHLQRLHITVNDCQIFPSSRIHFLGMILQSNLKWNSHIDKICISCTKPLNVIKFLRRTWWGSDPNLLLKIYRSLIRSRI